MADFTVPRMSTALPADAGPGRDSLPWGRLLVLSGAAFATVTTELLPASLLLELADDLAVPESTAGLLVTAWALTLAASSILLVRLSARVPRRILLMLVLLVFAVATAGTAVAPTFEWAMASRVVAAAAHGVFWSLLVPITAALVPPQVVGRAVSVVLAGPAVAGVVGIPLGAAIGTGVGWRAAFGLLAVLLVVAALGVRALRLPDPPAASTPAGLRHPGLAAVLATALGGGLVLTGHVALYTYVAPLLQDVGGYDAGARTGLLLVFGLTGLGGIALSGPLSDRFPRQALGWVCAGFAVAAALLTPIGVGPLAAVLAVAVWGVLIGLLPPVFQTRLLRMAPPGAEAVTGAIGVTVLNLGIAAGAALGGLVLDRRGAAALPVVAAALIAVAAVELLVVGRSRRPESW